MKLNSYLDELYIFFVVALGWCEVDATGGELVLGFSDDVGVEEVVEQRQQTAPIPVVSDTPPVVTLAGHVGDGIERNIIVLVDKHLQTDNTSRSD